MSQIFNLEKPTNASVICSTILDRGDLVRLTYKKEKQSNYRVRMGILQDVEKRDGEIYSLTVLDYTVDPDDFYLTDPGIRKFLWSRIGELHTYSPFEPSSIPNTPDQVSFNLPAGHVALVKIGTPDVINRKVK